LTTDTTFSVTKTASSSKKWEAAITALHGNVYHPLNDVSLTFGYDLFCAPACTFPGLSTDKEKEFRYSLSNIQNGYNYNVYVDGLPAAYKSETEYGKFVFVYAAMLFFESKSLHVLSISCFSLSFRDMVGVTYWGGIPVGNGGLDSSNKNSRNNSSTPNDSDSTTTINNHWNIEIWYRPSKHDTESYSIVRVVVEPFSVLQESASGKLASCDTVNTPTPVHTNYDMVYNFPPVPFVLNQPFQFTYDVIWTEAPEDLSHNKRWDVYLDNDGAIPNYVEFAGFFLGGFILVSLVGVLLTWVLRDLSYKPIIDHPPEEDGESTDASTVQVEIQMWPLSNRIFFPPVRSRLLLCIACGTGAQLMTTAISFILLFRVGIISQSQSARLLTPAIVLFSMCSAFGGYVTARLYAIFHGDIKVAVAASLVAAIAYPLIGLIVVFIVYDILPSSDAPDYNVSSTISPLITLWICFIWPVTMLSGYFGFQGGPIQNFPVSEGSSGYHDLNLQNEEKKESDGEPKSRWLQWNNFTKKHRIPILLLTGGFLPVLSCFVNYSYGVAGPTLLRYYSVRPYMISSFLIFMLLSGTEAVFLFYRQIRTQPTYEWWWAAFSAAGSAGIYIYALSMSYLIFRGQESNLSGTTVVSYMIWFAFTSFGVLLMTGFMGVALNIIFIRALYTYIMNRQQ
jgi:transmembrane 9 superfamily protein 2/4